MPILGLRKLFFNILFPSARINPTASQVLFTYRRPSLPDGIPEKEGFRRPTHRK
jgi:hypothetical protein